MVVQVKAEQISNIPQNGLVSVKSKYSTKILGVLNIKKIEKLQSHELIARKWFGTDDKKHPGVEKYFDGGEYIISGEPYLIKDNILKKLPDYSLSPKQTREIFNHNGWHDIIGFHTRNVVHCGHEHIQRKALEITNADAIFISPVTGVKKKGDFTSDIIIDCYNKIIQNRVYEPHSVLLGSFSTYSRYCGPREAVFTALCRKNYGCNYFIIGRDHTGVGSYYAPEAAGKYFANLDTGLKILHFNEAYYCNNRKRITTEPLVNDDHSSRVNISGTNIREAIEKNLDIPSFIMRPETYDLVKRQYNKNPNLVFEM